MATDLEKNCTLKFSDDVAMTAALREATKVDREVVEEIRIEVEGIDQSFQEEKEEIDIKHADVVLKHGEVITAKAEVDTAKAEVEVIQTDVTDKQTDITAKRDEVNATHTLVVDEGKRIKQDIDNFDQTVTDVTQTIDNFNSTTAGKLQAITDEGNTQVQRVNTTGTQQNQLVLDTGADEQKQVQDEGQTQINLINTLSTNEQNEITTKGNEEVARVIAEGETQENRITAAGSNELVDITDKATEQIGRVTAAGDAEVARVDGSGDTEIAQIIAEGDIQEARSKVEADRAKSEADRATTEAGKAATEAVKAKSEADNATAEANRAKVEADRAETEGDTQVARIISEGDTQDTRIITEGDTQAARVINEGDTQTANATAEADRAADEAAEAASSKVGAQAAQQIAQTAEQGAQAAEQGAINARDDATAIVHNDEGSVVPKPGAYPVAKSDATIDSRWLLLAKTPYSAPLINNFLLMQGTGEPVLMDLSPAGDGSIMRAVPYLNTIKVTGDEGEFTDEGFKFGRGSILSPTPEVKGIARAVSAVLKEPTAAVANVAYTLNYNGDTSYVEISEWKPEGEFEIECDVYQPSFSGFETLLDGRSNSSDPLSKGLLRTGSSGLQDDWYSLNGTHKSTPVSVGFRQVRLTGVSTGQLRVCTIGGQGYGGNHFKGQISNLKLIDKTNPENSRFYPGVIYSYVDPDATDVPMPQSTVLVDEWCVPVEVYLGTATSTATTQWGTTHFTDEPKFPIGLYGITLTVSGMPVGGQVRVRLANHYSQAITGDGVYDNFVQCNYDNAPILLQDMTAGLSQGVTVGISVTKVTHGICTNFGTAQPYVPLLGDREEYNGFRNNAHYIRGVSTTLPYISGGYGNGLPGSYFGKADQIPTQSIFECNGITEVNLGGGNAYDVEVTTTPPSRVFQYPNTFKVIKPLDKDYNDYAPDDWMDWTLNFDGEDSYVGIPEWLADNAELTMDVYVDNIVSRYIVQSGGRPSWQFFGLICERPSNSDVLNEFRTGTGNRGWVDGVEIGSGISGGASVPATVGWHKVRITGSCSNGLKVLGSNSDSSGAFFKGQIYNLRLTDLDNPSNSRFYPLIQKGSRTPEGMPDITVAKEMLGNPTTYSKQLTVVSTAQESSQYLMYVSGTTKAELLPWFGKIGKGIEGVTCNGFKVSEWSENSTGLYIYLQGTPTNPPVTGDKLTLVRDNADGTLVNFGTDAPFVPKLGEGEGYVQNYNEADAYINGVWVRGSEVWLATLDSPVDGLAIGTTFVAGSATLRVIDPKNPMICSKVSGTDEEIQAGFQYPNTFKITPPEGTPNDLVS